MPCPTPENVTDGQVEIGGIAAIAASPLLNDTADYSCDPGYDLEGAAVRTCEARGPGWVDWDPAVPTCNRMLSSDLNNFYFSLDLNAKFCTILIRVCHVLFTLFSQPSCLNNQPI